MRAPCMSDNDNRTFCDYTRGAQCERSPNRQMAEKKSCVEAFVVSAWRAALWVLERLPVSSRGLIADLERIIPQTRRTQQSSRRLWSQSVLQRLNEIFSLRMTENCHAVFRLPSNSVATMLIPVVLPSGRASEVTSLLPSPHSREPRAIATPKR